MDFGAMYKELHDSYVIFICVPDIFEKGYAKYTFENLCIEDPKIKLNDRTYKYFFIAKNFDKLLNEKQKAFLKLVMNNESTSAFADKVSKLVENAKHNTMWRKQFMDLEREKIYAFNNGKQEGTQQKALEDAMILIKDFNVSPEEAAKKMNAPLEKLLQLQAEMK